MVEMVGLTMYGFAPISLIKDLVALQYCTCLSASVSAGSR